MRSSLFALTLVITVWLSFLPMTGALTRADENKFPRDDKDRRPIVVLPVVPAAGTKPNVSPKETNEVIAGLIRQPRLYYPVAAQYNGTEGHGVCMVRFDTVTGQARNVTVSESSDEWVLDQATVRVLRTWHIKPHTYDKIYVRFKYEEKGTSYFSSCSVLIPTT